MRHVVGMEKEKRVCGYFYSSNSVYDGRSSPAPLAARSPVFRRRICKQCRKGVGPSGEWSLHQHTLHYHGTALDALRATCDEWGTCGKVREREVDEGW